MKVKWAGAAIAVSMLQLGFVTCSLFGQAAGGANRPITPVAPRSSGATVAVIDISQVFEKHGQFQTQMLGLKKQVEEFEMFLRGEQKKMTTLRDDLQNYAPGSPQYKAKEEEMARVQSDLNVKMALQRKEFLEKEARIYYDTYNEVYQIVAEVSDRHGIGLVLRFNSEEMKPEDRASVLQGVNRAVVFQRNLNITNMVVGELAKRYPQAVAERPITPGSGIAPSGQGAPGPGTKFNR